MNNGLEAPVEPRQLVIAWVFFLFAWDSAKVALLSIVDVHTFFINIGARNGGRFVRGACSVGHAFIVHSGGTVVKVGVLVFSRDIKGRIVVLENMILE